ncbi:hypothetical protein ACFWYW_46705 [Nonomuraea sp. NPDC059023]|uniref:hypothetical protein n=1 Tax=unclassified Nonomuraea TaxID=2593643 RepID=UPI0036A2F612
MKVPPPSSSFQPQPGAQINLRRSGQGHSDSASQDSSGAPDQLFQIDFVVDPAKDPRQSAVAALAELGRVLREELETEGLEIAGPQRFEVCYFRGSGTHQTACPPQNATHGTALVRVRIRPRQSITAQPAPEPAASPVRSPAPGPHLDLALRALASRIIGVPLIVDTEEP